MEVDYSEIVAMFVDTPWSVYPGAAVTNLGPEVRWWERRTGQERSWWLLCHDCAEPLTRDPHVYDRLLPLGYGEPSGSAGRGIRPRPTDFEGETCYTCGCRLGND